MLLTEGSISLPELSLEMMWFMEKCEREVGDQRHIGGGEFAEEGEDLGVALVGDEVGPSATPCISSKRAISTVSCG